MPNYIDELNEGQRAAVLYNEGPSLIIAGAGSGKTRVLTYKIAYLLENGYQPWNILALTFTNKAAREMKERIAKQVGEKTARYLWMGTFHSIFLRILHAEADKLGFTPKFTIYDTADSKSLIRTIMKEMKLDEKVYRPNVVMGRISRAKNHLISPAEYASNPQIYQTDQSMKMPYIREIYSRYMQRCKMSDAMDFDDLLYFTYLLFRDNEEVLEEYRERFKYILVDEYQDTNMAQDRIVQQLGGKHQRVCVVGDDAQSIYSFRGADIGNILSFRKSFRNAQLFKLEQNYRSTQMIVNAANSLIGKNVNQIPKEVFSKNEEGEKLKVIQAYSDMEEADIVSAKVQNLHRYDHEELDSFAVLYRTNAQSRLLEDAFRKKGLEYRVYGGLSFYQRKEIKDVIAYLRLAVNPNDEEAFKRIINYPARGIGNTTVEKLMGAAREHQVSLWEVLKAPLEHGMNINKGTLGKLKAFEELMSPFIEEAPVRNADELGAEIIGASGIMAVLTAEDSVDNEGRAENINEFGNALHDFCASRREEGNENILLSDFLSEISLMTDQDADNENGKKITLMTIHAAKGLEFRNVFVVGLEEDLFPSAMSRESGKELEEERRLFYVAITRAEKRCFLSYAKSRMKYGKVEMARPSRFLKDISSKYLAVPAGMAMGGGVEQKAREFRRENSIGTASYTRGTAAGTSRWTRMKTTEHNAAERTVTELNGLKVGMTVMHERFGKGTVQKLEGEGDNAKATIAFENVGVKQLLLRFARFK